MAADDDGLDATGALGDGDIEDDLRPGDTACDTSVFGVDCTGANKLAGDAEPDDDADAERGRGAGVGLVDATGLVGAGET